ncbi:aldo/keto reductase [Auraticoccus sp. F435]|uniref:Aldo/keto reductase n=1 Tax=Auraticoccus cholistanensis TaxID=2656650 RepID=A0A6A9URE0_9ACTN|nr:aldo/keto reductase [Auraticoccus cholistanensis]MVA75231.1 aldo/keto reductase [Auraticoccus cholistanensis]
MTQVPNVTLNDGATIPQLGFGVWQVEEDDIVPAVSAALEIGYRHIDTAQMYGNEEGVGKAIAQSGIPRDEIFVTTKLSNQRHGDPEVALQESLERLGMDRVDLYLVHWPLQEGTHVQAWEGLLRAREQGLTTSVGVSNYHAHHLDDIISATGVTPVVDQVELHPTFTQVPLVQEIRSRGIEVEAWTPLGRGDLEEDVITGLAERLGRSPGQVVLRWHLQKGYIVFPKSVTPSRIKENFEVFDFELTEDDIAAIDGLDRGERTGGHPDEL